VRVSDGVTLGEPVPEGVFEGVPVVVRVPVTDGLIVSVGVLLLVAVCEGVTDGVDVTLAGPDGNAVRLYTGSQGVSEATKNILGIMQLELTGDGVWLGDGEFDAVLDCNKCPP
jgi:hypothetical protein